MSSRTVLNKIQRDLLAACDTRRVKPTYDAVRKYAYEFKKYDNLTIRQIGEVVRRLKKIY